MSSLLWAGDISNGEIYTAIARLARLRATQVSSTWTYVNAVAVYDFVPGHVYQVYTSPVYDDHLAQSRVRN